MAARDPSKCYGRQSIGWTFTEILLPANLLGCPPPPTCRRAQSGNCRHCGERFGHGLRSRHVMVAADPFCKPSVGAGGKREQIGEPDVFGCAVELNRSSKSASVLIQPGHRVIGFVCV